MVLDIDYSRALRTNNELVDLVLAIRGAADSDESRAVEWKRGYDSIVTAEAAFALGRAILGMANRPVATASAMFEGAGYIVVGAEPGSIRGQALPDSVEILEAIRRYTGHGWPRWDGRLVSVEGRDVYVVTVEAPTPGDRIALLQKSFQPAGGKSLVSEGTIFVRQPGSTERATRLDVEMLQDRLLDGTVDNAIAARATDLANQIRDALTDYSDCVSRWADSVELMVIMSARSSWSQQDLVEWLNTDSGKAMAEANSNATRVARKLGLLPLGDALEGALRSVEQLREDRSVWDSINHPATARGSSDEQRTSAYRQLARLKRSLETLQETARQLSLSGALGS